MPTPSTCCKNKQIQAPVKFVWRLLVGLSHILSKGAFAIPLVHLMRASLLLPETTTGDGSCIPRTLFGSSLFGHFIERQELLTVHECTWCCKKKATQTTTGDGSCSTRMLFGGSFGYFIKRQELSTVHECSCCKKKATQTTTGNESCITRTLSGSSLFGHFIEAQELSTLHDCAPAARRRQPKQQLVMLVAASHVRWLAVGSAFLGCTCCKKR